MRQMIKEYGRNQSEARDEMKGKWGKKGPDRHDGNREEVRWIIND